MVMNAEKAAGRSGELGFQAMEYIETLYHEHGPALLRYLQGAFGYAANAEDLLQETFLRAVAGRRKVQAAVSARAWLFGIARHVGLDALRRRRPGAALPADLAAPAVIESDARIDRMRQAVQRLPEEQRQTLELRLVGELSYEEIGSVLEIPVGTVRSRLHGAVRRLREILTG